MINNLDLRNIFVRRANTDQDIKKAFEVRWEGYKKYYNNIDIIKEPVLSNEILLLALNEKDNPIGTMRVLDRRLGPLELDSFIDVDSLLKNDEFPCAEASRFVVPENSNKDLIKLALWKAFYMYCSSNNIITLLFSTRPSMAKIYSILLFEYVGDKGSYCHPMIGGKKHITYKLNIPKSKPVWKNAGHPLYDFFTQDYPNITCD